MYQRDLGMDREFESHTRSFPRLSYKKKDKPHGANSLAKNPVIPVKGARDPRGSSSLPGNPILA